MKPLLTKKELQTEFECKLKTLLDEYLSSIEYTSRIKALLAEYSSTEYNASIDIYIGLIWITIPIRYDDNDNLINNNTDFALCMKSS